MFYITECYILKTQEHELGTFQSDFYHKVYQMGMWLSCVFGKGSLCFSF